MEIITFEEWKNSSEKYNANTDEFEITFQQWADSENDFINDLKGNDSTFYRNHSFRILTQKGEEVSSDDFPKTSDFDKTNHIYINKYEFCTRDNMKDPCEPTSYTIKTNQAYIMKDFFAIIFLWCLKKVENKIVIDKNLESFTGTELNIKLADDCFVNFAVRAETLYPRVKYLFSTYLKDYSDYKVRIIPNNPSNNNGGKENMSDTTDNKIEINDYIKEKIDAHKQIIFTGAPGTGKTHSVREYVKNATQNDESRYKFVQFHSSYDYTDFVEGIRPAPKGNGTTNNSGENMFVRMDGTFKAFCRKIVNANIKDLKKHGIDNIEALYKIMKESKTDPDAIKKRRENIAKAISKLPMYYFVIDEINRADLSKVFGELMFGLEEDYRGVQNRFPTQYSNLPTYEMKEDKAVISEKDCFKNGFFVPENLTIIGTMNDIDRSVETFDFALRRRFAWVEIKANEVMLYSVASINNKSKDEVEDIVKKIQEMNEIISGEGKKLGLNESYHIGPAYFKNLFDSNGNDNRETIFNEKIEPLLREYTRGRNSEKVEALISGCKNALFDKSKTTDTSGGNNG